MATSKKTTENSIDISKLVSAVQNRFGKKKALADDICSGDGISLPKDDSAYIIAKDLDFWPLLTGTKGIPWGRIVQFSGRPDSGKSSTAMKFMKAAQDSGALVVLWDSEKKFLPSRFVNHMGGDASKLAISRSKLITEGAKQISWMVQAAKEQNPDVKVFIVWDSVGATMNTSEDDEDDDYSKQPGVTAREVSWAIKKFNKLIEKYRNVETGEETIAVCCVNQVYAKIGFMASGFQEKGGQELEFLSSLILQMTRTGDMTKQSNNLSYKTGITTKVKVKKNHLFDGTESISELELQVTADGVSLIKNKKPKKTEQTPDVEEKEVDDE